MVRCVHTDLFALDTARDEGVEEILDAALDVFAKIGILSLIHI